MKAKMETPLPRAPHPDTLRDPNFTILDASSGQLLCWCPLHRCGAVYHIETRIWTMQSEVGFGEFLAALRSRGFLPNCIDELKQWIETCSAAERHLPNAPGGVC